ncbi:MAG: GntR family transcriptional regulator, partial [Candidatus Omnitrophica bacterium]|nr:GntR family transcriptional regulator [Candidatus Omnitrophota bacterium]
MKFNASLVNILNSPVKLSIVKFLLTHEASMSEREIASILKVSHMSINRAMREFWRTIPSPLLFTWTLVMFEGVDNAP